ncbi:MAG: hypothetical protein A2992_10025 [Elusimicrobia bacterium RIFCSPLOWO2_01_FULL_59_12]|nr:MAG: hypothetical protein A2992_10025 [Elusimicrobia bacterium RIFCSPLOWO2_01_FULL_59_12]
MNSSLNARLRVLHIHSSADVGGTELRAFQVAGRLKSKFDIAVLFHSRPGAMLDYYRQEGIPFWNVRFPWFWPALRHIHQFRPDLVHIFGPEVNVLWRPLLRFLGHRRLVGHTAGLSNFGEKPTWLRISLDRLTYKLLTVYVANSSRVAEQLVSYGFDKDKLRVVRNGIVIPETLPASGAHQPPVVISVGNLRPVKGHRFLLDALRLLSERGIAFEARIIGEGPGRADLESLAQRYGIADRVRFLGAVENSAISAALHEGDVFALMSLSEGIPGAAMEAMAAGLPVVATQVGGMEELVTDGVDGYLVPLRDTAAAAGRLAALLQQPSLRETMGRAAYAKVTKSFNLDNTVREYEKLYSTTSLLAST